ncbi:MAG: sulfatase family protein [Planctomycetota bacterium]|jgi:arylsulfatase A-like enzyme
MMTLRLTLFALLVSAATTTRAADRPNIVMILTDDQGWGEVSAYGAKDLRTPAIDKLMDRGMRFDNFYANCPVCSPTRAALLTGRYQELVGVPGVVRTHAHNNWGYLRQDAVLIPQVLKPAGYHTAIVGKWHLGLEPENHPVRRGFDHFKGFLGDMMDDYYNHLRHGNHYMQEGLRDIHPEGHATDLFTRWSVDYIKRRAKTGEPFFLYLAYNAPHTPIQPPAEWTEKVKKREAGIDDARAKLVALIEHMDEGIGKVIDALDDAGVADNTLVIFSSDNGGQGNVGGFNGPYRGFKQETYEGGIRVPFAAVWPGVIKPGTVSKRRAITMDLFPTMTDAAGVQINHPIDGVTILPTLLGQEQEDNHQRQFVFSRREGGDRYMGQTIWALIQGDYKLLKNSPMEPYQLYQIKQDPYETNDLATKHRKKYSEMAAKLRLHIQRGGAVPWQRPGADLVGP